ncbi:hypothetical protein PsAD2_01700 [Pseudovibrio axinellae]|uniref:Uncharacterized protein n=1 Tax=Pseudovibrio axinellae TaxID=989403 RepID=A0A165ZGN1_9HYPH|nr:hypothetical protein [Pseudovibrio axinellae]KZL19878.1 hypothetical protein PsAD2_01700 [Pseudovibrio axinellae]SER38432.1 hypothetical protein SAMN05421798_10964 [Pseudovibrio axinellae]
MKKIDIYSLFYAVKFRPTRSKLRKAAINLVACIAVGSQLELTSSVNAADLPEEILIGVSLPNLTYSEHGFKIIEAYRQPLGFGVPFIKGDMTQEGFLNTTVSCIVDEKRETIPSHPLVKNIWSDDSVRWAWVDFLWASNMSDCHLDTGNQLATGTIAVSNTPVTTKDLSGGALEVDNGNLKLTFGTSKLFPEAIEQFDGDSYKSVLDETVDANFYIKDRYECDSSECDEPALATLSGNIHWVVERDSPLRTVIKGTASYITQDGVSLAQAVLRYTIFSNAKYIDIEHRLVNNRKNVEYTEMGIELGLSPEFTLLALEEEKAEQQVYAGLQNVLAITNTQDHRFKIWSAEEDERFDYIDYRPETVLKSFPQDYQDTLDGILGYTSDLDTVVDWLENVVPPSALGVARTHNLRLALSQKSNYDLEREKFLVGTFVQPILSSIDPKYLTHRHSSLFPVMATYEEGNEYSSELENLRSQWFDNYISQGDWYPSAGWYDYGRAPYNRFMKNEQPNSDGSERIYPNWYRQTISQYHIIRNSIFSWARSGDRKYMDFARKSNRHTRDFHFVHDVVGDLNSVQKIAGQYMGGFDSRFPIYWSRPGSQGIQQFNDGEDLSAFMYEYFLMDNLSSLDVLQGYYSALQYYLESFDTTMDPASKRRTIKENYFNTTPFPSMSAMLSTYKAIEGNFSDGQAVHHEDLKSWLEEFLPLFYDANDIYGLSPAYWTENFEGHNTWTPYYKLDRKLSFLLDAYHFFEVEPPTESAELDLSLLPSKLANVYSNPEQSETFKKGVFISQSLAPLFYGVGYEASCSEQAKIALNWNLEMAKGLAKELSSPPDIYKDKIDIMPTRNNSSGWSTHVSQYLTDNPDLSCLDKDDPDEGCLYFEYHIEPSRNSYMLYALPVAIEHARSAASYCESP